MENLNKAVSKKWCDGSLLDGLTQRIVEGLKKVGSHDSILGNVNGQKEDINIGHEEKR